MTGVVTDIQRFSVHDGPGIRTSVFLKGCNMKCGWCHNPETINARPELEVYPDKCIGCGACLEICPVGAHRAVHDHKVFHRELCEACGACAQKCYAEALVLAGKEMSAEEAVKELMEDLDFYKSTNGGITITGGEPLFQRDFTHEILQLCKERNIHTAIESNMAWPYQIIESILPVTDLIMMDIKIMDNAMHQKWTGVSNKLVLENAKKLSQNAIPVIIRTPVVPGINDTIEEIGTIAAFISDFPNLLYYELLPYHPLGSSKYESLGREYLLDGLKRPVKEKMKLLADTARSCGIKVRSTDDN